MFVIIVPLLNISLNNIDKTIITFVFNSENKFKNKNKLYPKIFILTKLN